MPERSRAEQTVYALGVAAGAVVFASILLTYRPSPAEIVMHQQRGRSPGWGSPSRGQPPFGILVRRLMIQEDVRGAYELALARLEGSPDDTEAALFAALAADRLRLPERESLWEELRAGVLRAEDGLTLARREYLLGWAARGLGEIHEAERRFGSLVAASTWMLSGRGGSTSEDAPPRADSGDLYNLACYLALAGEADATLDMLDAAVDAGWADAAWPAADPDLEIVWGHPRFKGAMERTWSNLPASP